MLLEQVKEATVSPTDAKNNLGALLSRVAECGESVIVVRQGKPRAAVISMDDYRQLRELQQAERHKEAVATIRRVREELSERNKYMTEQEVEEFADRVTRESIERVVAKRGIRFE